MHFPHGGEGWPGIKRITCTTYLIFYQLLSVIIMYLNTPRQGNLRKGFAKQIRINQNLSNVSGENVVETV